MAMKWWAKIDIMERGEGRIDYYNLGKLDDIKDEEITLFLVWR